MPRSFLLEENYRSTKTILQAANDVIKNNRHRRPKNLWTQNEDGEEIVYYRANDEQDEAVFVAKTIEELSRSKLATSTVIFAVLYRTNAQSRTIEEALLKSNILYHGRGHQVLQPEGNSGCHCLSELDCQPQ